MPRADSILPTELIQMILRSNRPALFEKPGYAIRAASVCRQWRSVALGTPSLWSTFGVRTRRHNPRLLALHAVCCKVAHASGAADYFNRLDWEMEETQELAADGSSGALLAAALQMVTGGPSAVE